MKKLYKSRENRVISGVCSGIAEYFDIDPVLVRVLFVLFFFFGGSAVLAYIIGMIIIPENPVSSKTKNNIASKKSVNSTVSKTNSGKNSLAVGLIFIVLGIFFLMGQIHFFRIYFHWIRHNFWEILFPLFLILFGFVIVFNSKSRN